MAESQAFKRYCRICWYCGRCYRVALTGSFNSAANWGGIIGVGALGFALQYFWGHALVPAETWSSIVGQGLLFIVAAWGVIFIARLFFYAPFVIHREGKWYGNTFVYEVPKLAFHTYLTPKENNREFSFRFPDAPPFSNINYKFEIDGYKHLLSNCVAAHPHGLMMFRSHEDFRYGGGSMRVNRDRDMYARFFLKVEASPLSVRIYVTGWTEHPTIEPPKPVQEKAEPAYFGGG